MCMQLPEEAFSSVRHKKSDRMYDYGTDILSIEEDKRGETILVIAWHHTHTTEGRGALFFFEKIIA